MGTKEGLIILAATQWGACVLYNKRDSIRVLIFENKVGNKNEYIVTEIIQSFEDDNAVWRNYELKFT